MQQYLPVLFTVAAIVLGSVPVHAIDDQPLLKILPELGDEADFAYRVAISGNFVIVGAPAIVRTTPSPPPPPGVGSAYLFDISDLTNPTRIKFHADDGVAGDGFGISVGISGPTVIVGATGALDSPARSGAAYLFDISDPSNPTQIAKLLSNDAVEVYSGLVALSGTTAIVGALSGNLVYLFDVSDPKNPTKFELRPGTGHAGELFGSSAAVSGTKVIVGAVSGTDDSDNSGSAFLFDVSDPANPTRIELLPDTGTASDFYGASVAIDGTTAIVGAPNLFGTVPSSAYLFDISDPASPTQVKLGVDGLTAGHLVGASVAISGTTAIVGVAAVLGAVGSSAYLFDISDPANQTPITRLISNDGEADDGFGISIGTNGKVAVVGASGHDAAGENAGAAYIFGVDSDGDGLLDDWEINGIPYVDAGGIGRRFVLPGAHRLHKDLYVEVDAMKEGEDASRDRTPSPLALEKVVMAFASAPNELVRNPDGLDGIKLHIEQIEPIPFVEDWSTIIIGEGGCDKWVQEFDEAKAIHFGTPEERMLPDWKDGRRTAKAKAFRYCIFADKYDGSTSTGLAELPGNDFMVTISKERMIAKYFKSFVDDRWDDAVAGTFMHELGHTLGLYHGGEQDSACGLEDRYNYKPNYHSVMNYSWQFPVPTYADSWVLDFSRAEWDDLDENNLTENDGIGGHEGHFVPYGPPSSSELSPENGPVNWNHVIGNQQVGVVADINYVNSAQSPSPGDLLWGQEDWSKLRFQMTDASSFEDGVHLGTTFGDEMTDEILAELGEIGRVDLMDFAEFQNCFTPNGGGRSLACDSLDFRGDGSIDLSDFFEFRRRWW